MTAEMKKKEESVGWLRPEKLRKKFTDCTGDDNFFHNLGNKVEVFVVFIDITTTLAKILQDLKPGHQTQWCASRKRIPSNQVNPNKGVHNGFETETHIRVLVDLR